MDLVFQNKTPDNNMILTRNSWWVYFFQKKSSIHLLYLNRKLGLDLTFQNKSLREKMYIIIINNKNNSNYAFYLFAAFKVPKDILQDTVKDTQQCIKTS